MAALQSIVHYCRTLRGLRAIGCHRIRRYKSLTTGRGARVSRSGLDVIYDKIRVCAPFLMLCAALVITTVFFLLQAGGPVTVAEYMRECLLHPVTVSHLPVQDLIGQSLC